MTAQERVISTLRRRVREVGASLDGPSVAYLAEVRHAAGGLARRDVAAADSRGALVEMEQLATVDVDVPTLSRRRPVRLVKVGVKQAGGWYMRYLGAQVTAFGLAAVRFGATLVERTDALERSGEATASQLAQLSARVERLEATAAPANTATPAAAAPAAPVTETADGVTRR